MQDQFENPFPLAQRYRSRVLPIIGVFVVSLVLLTALAVERAVEDINLQFAADRVDEVVGEIRSGAPGDWEAIMAGRSSPATETQLNLRLANAAKERGIPRLKVYDAEGRTLFSTQGEVIGALEADPALTESIQQNRRVLLLNQDPDGTTFNEFYVPFSATPGGPVAVVFELYEPAHILRGIIWRALLLPTIVPVVLLAALIVTLGYLIRRAQAEIDLRAKRVQELSARLESFISSSAVGAVRGAETGGDVPLRRVETALLYSDVRKFTDFSETASPEAVVAFLHEIMTLQIGCVAKQGGDVDKLIGDALLARFEGDGKERRAVAAALEIQEVVEHGLLPRGLGIGIFTGSAICGPIGPERRRDYTVIGDTVNIAARLCREAGRGEIVADATSLARSGMAGLFGPVEEIRVKGRQGPIALSRRLFARETLQREVERYRSF
jgi:class 3 adenylate cyclase